MRNVEGNRVDLDNEVFTLGEIRNVIANESGDDVYGMVTLLIELENIAEERRKLRSD